MEEARSCAWELVEVVVDLDVGLAVLFELFPRLSSWHRIEQRVDPKLSLVR